MILIADEHYNESEAGRSLHSRIDIFTIQGHPELTKPIVFDLLEVMGGFGSLGTDLAEKMRSKQTDDNDCRVVAEVIWNILLGNRMVPQ